MGKRFLFFLFCLQSFCSQSQNDLTFSKQLKALQSLITTSHYSPKPVNDSLSKGVFELFVGQLDEDKRYFLQSDLVHFKSDEFKLDDYLASDNCKFIHKYSDTLKKRILESKAIVESLQNETFDYSGRDTLYFTPNNEHDYFKDAISAKRYWNKRIRYLIITKLIDEDSLIDQLKQDFISQEAVLKPKIINSQLCMLDEALHQNGNFDTYVEEAFLNALVHYEDPNSSFFNTSEKAEFEGTVANNKLSFGLTTNKTNDGTIVINYIVPGSAAFLDGRLEENDIIKSLKSKDDFLETYCVSNEDILAFINDERHSTIEFTVKKPNSIFQEVTLTKMDTKVEDNSVRGYVLEDGSDVGYIKIPSFYTDLETPKGLGLANDVAKELNNLNQEDIKALVLDLRFNGGGSMKEAAELSGMFIDKGPLSIIRYPNNETYIIKDAHRGALFTKPIVILINNYSASASEFFASAMQDYSRAVIVGSPSHGKSSAQVILPLSESENLGYCKLTVEKFYRITGLSHQSVGIIPDVTLPSLYDNLKTGERYEPFALCNDTVNINLRYRTFTPIPLQQISNNSLKRTEASQSFTAIKNINAIVLKDYMNNNSEYPLTLDNIYNDLNGYNTLWTNFYAQMATQASTLSVRNSRATQEIMDTDIDANTANDLVIKDIKEDIYVEEAYHIALDVLNAKGTD